MAFVPTIDVAYSTKIGYILIFNLIVGTGALALPKAFHSAGCLLGVLLLSISAFMSYVCATFVVEGMAIANACNKKRRIVIEYSALNTINLQSGMARLFIGKYGVLLLNVIVAIYLFDHFELHIYLISLSETFSQSVNASTEDGHNACYNDWPNWLQRITVYRFNVCLFVCFVAPLVLIGIHRTKFLQLSTSICRWTAFTLMIVLACMQLAREGSPSMPKMFNIHGFGSLFGTTVYAFMCHHSLPSIVTPMKSKRHIFIYLAMVYVLVLIFYLALAITGTFSFSHIFD
uniref:Amino acid transporter transmembrane domain-containing protein n=1 Tax=Parascaris equorum TaxID=6256 RepID=A0A914RTP2_PAREQ